MAESIVGNMNLVAKIYFPRDILVIAAMLARVLDFLIASLVLVVLMVAFSLPVFQVQWLFLPVILLVQLALALGIGLMLAALNAFYRDVRHLVALLLQLWLYATPIIYPVSLVPERLRPYYFINPMAGVIEAYRAVLLYGQMPGNEFYISAAVALIVLLLGYSLFKRVEHRFADIV
jgi:lipopolysaccharide transport system permease protein